MGGTRQTEHQQHPANEPSKFTTAVESRLIAEVKNLAKARGTTFRAVVEEALQHEVQQDAAKRTGDLLRSALHEVVEDRLQQVEYGLRRLIAVVGMEALRTQFVLLNFLVDAGIPKERVDAWREQGHEYAVRQLKNRTKQKPDDL